MSNRKKIARGVAGGFVLLVVLLAALAFLVPRWINLEAVKAGIQARAFRATKGRVYKLTLLSKVLALLNVTQPFLGKVPDLAQDGFAYNSLSIKGTLSDGKLKIGESVLDGSSMNIVGQGEVDVRTGKVDIAALASPLKTVDTILLRIPVVRYILGGSLVSVAVKAEGDLDEPTVSILPPSAVVKGLLGVVERVLKLPVRIFEGGVP